MLQLGYVVVLAGASVLQLLPMDAWLPSLALGLIAGGAAALAYARTAATRSLLSILAPAPLVFAGVFLLLSDVPPLVLDEPYPNGPSEGGPTRSGC